MANLKSSKKDFLKSKNRRKYNINYKSMLRTFTKKVKKAINSQNKSESITTFITMQKIIDRQINKGLIHKNKAARHKSKIYKLIKFMNTK